MPKQQTGFDALKRIVVLAIQLTQLLFFGVGTALVFLSNIRGKRLTPFRPFTPPSAPAAPLRLPSARPAKAETSTAVATAVVTATVTPVYAGYVSPMPAPRQVEPETVEPRVTLDPTFTGAMKSLGFTKAELQCIMPSITAQDLTGQIKQALRLLNKPTVNV